MQWLCSVTHRHVVAEHYLEGRKYMVWYYIEKHPEKTIGILQVRGLKHPLTAEELKVHIDKRWEEYYKAKEKKCESKRDI